MIFTDCPCSSSSSSSSSSFEKAKLNSTNEPEILHVNRFSSGLVRRHIVNPFTSFETADYVSL